MQKLISFVTIVAVMGFGAVAAYALGSTNPVSPSSVSTAAKVEAEPLPPVLTPGSYTLDPVVIVGKAPSKAKPAKATEKRWVCGQPRSLMNDATQTVRHCDWI